MTIETVLVHIRRGRVEVSASAQNSFPFAVLAFFPFIDFLFANVAVEGNDRERCQLRQLVEFCEERGEHTVINGTRLVDADSDASLSRDFLSWVDVTIAFVHSLHGAALGCSARSLDEVAQNAFPVQARGQSFDDLPATSR